MCPSCQEVRRLPKEQQQELARKAVEEERARQREKSLAVNKQRLNQKLEGKT